VPCGPWPAPAEGLEFAKSDNTAADRLAGARKQSRHYDAIAERRDDEPEKRKSRDCSAGEPPVGIALSVTSETRIAVDSEGGVQNLHSTMWATR